MSYEYTKLVVQKENRILTAAINHPPANAMAQAVLRDLNNLLDENLTNDEVRIIIITGTGERLFSAGADITEFGRPPDGPRVNGNDVYFKIESYPKIVIAALQGSAYGGGLELACACHLRIMAENAKVGLPEVKLAILPGWGGTQRLPRYIGKARALEMILTGDPISAQEALAYGLVNKIVPAGSVMNEAKAFAMKLAAGAPVAQREILKAVTQGLQTTLEEGVYKIEAAGSRAVAASQDAKEGPRAFLEKRPPNFQGK
jgi:enoyl-CoA hydratase/carnithine racemase